MAAEEAVGHSRKGRGDERNPRHELGIEGLGTGERGEVEGGVAAGRPDPRAAELERELRGRLEEIADLEEEIALLYALAEGELARVGELAGSTQQSRLSQLGEAELKLALRHVAHVAARQQRDMALQLEESRIQIRQLEGGRPAAHSGWACSGAVGAASAAAVAAAEGRASVGDGGGVAAGGGGDGCRLVEGIVRSRRPREEEAREEEAREEEAREEEAREEEVRAAQKEVELLRELVGVEGEIRCELETVVAEQADRIARLEKALRTLRDREKVAAAAAAAEVERTDALSAQLERADARAAEAAGALRACQLKLQEQRDGQQEQRRE